MLKHRKNGNEKGIVLIVVLILMSILTLLGLSANRNVVTDMLISSNHLSSVKAFYASEGGAQYGFNRLWQELQKLNPDISGITPPSMIGYTIADSSYISSMGGAVTRATAGPFDGLIASNQRYRITSTATESSNNALGKVVIEVEDQLIPVFQFGILYHDDLEISPRADMTFAGGRIHSNSDIYLAAHDAHTISIDSKITSAGSIFHSDKAGRTDRSGLVRIEDANFVYQGMDIDSTSAHWSTQSQTKWGGRVKNDVHGIRSINMPLSSGDQPIDTLGTGAHSLYSKAGLRIIDGEAKDKSGNSLDLRYYNPDYKNTDGTLKIDPGGTEARNVNPISTRASNPAFYDGREQKTMTAVEIDLAKLQNSDIARNALNDPPSQGEKGVLYASSGNVSNPAVRLIHGGTLDSTKLPQGLSVATNNPLYVKGDYNTANRPAAFFADAVTVLSENWDDALSSDGISSRPATNTIVKAAIMAGNKNTTDSDYSGGAENFIRFLEDWSGKTVTYAGSLICLWQSRHATRKWPGIGSVYKAPARNWSFGIDFSNLPPGTPMVRHIRKLGWRQVTN